MYRSVKRIMDILLAGILLLLLSPFFLFVPILIFFVMRSPVMFTQERLGLNNKSFSIYKYRTMTESNSLDLPDYQRITLLGRILRVLRLDEIPQIYNILRGDMSFIGPRPLLKEYLKYFTAEELKRHEVRPGLSGLSQVKSSYPSWEKQFEYDIQYVNNMSFKLDVTIFIMTFNKIIRPTKKLISGHAGRPRLDYLRPTPKNSI